MIFCVEDDDGIRNLMLYTLNSSGYNSNGFATPEEFWKELEITTPKLIILDIMLPGEDGISILKKLRSNNTTKDIPVIIASAKGTEYDKVLGLDLGADDYLAKPFGMMEMISRVKSVLRRVYPKTTAVVLKCGLIEMDVFKHNVLVNGKEVILTLKEFDILKLFLENLDIVYTREQLLKIVWGEDFLGETRTVDVHIGTLRTKLLTAGKQIETVRGVGYKMEASKI